MTIAQNIKKMRDLHEDYEEKIEEIQKKQKEMVYTYNDKHLKNS